MLIGEYEVKIDNKRRLSIPSRIREELGKRVVVARWLNKSIAVFPLREWENISNRIKEQSTTKKIMRDFSRFMYAGAYETEVDTAGRILIPEKLFNFANLTDTVIVVGIHDRIEIWNQGDWNKYKEVIEKEADKIAEEIQGV